MNWSDLTPKQQAQIEKEYLAGKEPSDIAPKYGLKPKQISDQAYRKEWAKPSKSSSSKKTAKKSAKKTPPGKKTAAKKSAAKKSSRKKGKKK